MNNKKYVITIIWVLFFGSGSAGAASFSSLYVLGDSLSDTGASSSSVLSIYKILAGNCDPGHPCPPYYDGRYSNGPVSVEYLSDAINSSNFSSYAIAGSTTGTGNSGDGGSVDGLGFLLLPGMAFQRTAYLPIINTSSDALHVVWGGANDYLTGDSASGAADNVGSYVGDLAEEGAKNILVPNLPDLSLTPFVQSMGQSGIEAAYDFSVEFNQVLASQLSNLSASFPDTNIFRFDTFSLFNGIFQDPEAYGFTNTVDACVALPDVCADSTGYLFWDDFHPTTQVHSIFGSAMASVVPIPSSIFLLAAGLIGLFFVNNPKRQSHDFI